MSYQYKHKLNEPLHSTNESELVVWSENRLNKFPHEKILNQFGKTFGGEVVAAHERLISPTPL